MGLWLLGASPTRAGEPITWSDAVDRAAEHAPDVVIAAANADVADAGVTVAGRLPDPTVYLGSTTHSYDLLAYLYVTLPVFGQTVTAAGAARAEAGVARAGVEVAALDARLAAGVAWIDLWERQRASALADQTLERRRRLLEAAQARLDEGAGTQLDVWRAETALARGASEAAALVDEVRASGARLSEVVGAAADYEAEGAPPSAVAFDPSAEDTLIDAHPVVRRGEALLGARHAAVRRERFALLPRPAVQLQGRFLHRDPTANQQELWWVVGLQLPIFDAPVVHQAVVAESAAQSQLDALVGVLHDRLQQAEASYAAAETRHAAEAGTVLPRAERAEAAAAEAFRSGALDLTAALAAEQELTDAQLSEVRAAAALARARIRLEHAAGRSL